MLTAVNKAISEALFGNRLSPFPGSPLTLLSQTVNRIQDRIPISIQHRVQHESLENVHLASDWSDGSYSQTLHQTQIRSGRIKSA